MLVTISVNLDKIVEVEKTSGESFDSVTLETSLKSSVVDGKLSELSMTCFTCF